MTSDLQLHTRVKLNCERARREQKTRKCDLDDTVYEIEKEIEERRFFKICQKFNELCLFHTYGERNFAILTCFGSGAFTIKCITVVKRVEKLFQVVNFPGGVIQDAVMPEMPLFTSFAREFTQLFTVRFPFLQVYRVREQRVC